MSATQPIPAGHVRVIRSTNTYHRSRNGAWFGATANPATVHDVPEDKALDWVNGEFVKVEWPDGYSEHFDCAVTPMRFSHFGTAEQCKTEERVVPAFSGKDYLGRPLELPESRYTCPTSRLGKVGYYRLERR